MTRGKLGIVGIIDWATLPEFAGTAALALVLTGCPPSDDYFILSEMEGGVGPGGGVTTDIHGVGGSRTPKPGGGGGAPAPVGLGGSGLAGSPVQETGGFGDGVGGSLAAAGVSLAEAGSEPGEAGGSSPPGAGGGGPPGPGGGGPGAGGSGPPVPPGSGGSNAADTGVAALYMNGFESSTAGWKVFGTTSANVTLSASTDQAHSGSKSLLTSGRVEKYQGPSYTATSVVKAGSAYHVQIWARLPDRFGTQGGFSLTAHALCGSQNLYSALADNLMVSSSDWTKLEGTGTIPTCTSGPAAPTAIDIYVEGPVTATSFYVDDMEIDPG